MPIFRLLRTARRWLAALAVLVPGPALAQAPATLSAPAAASLAAGAPLKPALWLVQDADTRIYLFGTIHVLEPGLRWFDGAVAKAFEGSDALVTEVAEVGGLDAAQTLLQSALLPPGQTLRGKLSAGDAAALEAALAKSGIPVAAIDRFKPWYAAVVLSSLPLMRAGFKLEEGVEMQLAKRAQDAGKKRDALETAAFQLGLFDSLPEASQIAYLRQVVDNLDQVTAQIATLVAEWGAGDADGLAAAMNADKSDPALIDALLTRRNLAWAEWIKARLDQPGTVFVAVGAGHLAGPGSVQSALAQRGITSERLQ
jgi:uncharacterized protein YbaP (TraB family)